MLDNITILQHTIAPLPLFTDNYAWLITHGNKAWVVDPGDAEPILAVLHEQKVDLAGILITHRHWDHVGGIEALAAAYEGIPVYGPPNIHPGINHPLAEGEQLAIGQLSFKVWHTPGHMDEHLSYYCKQAGWLICGDTLFSAGCGRLKQTGNMQALHASLQRIATLPTETLLFCAHEYTANNLVFANAVEPENNAITAYIKKTKIRRENNLPTIPSQLSDELAINSFLRLSEPAVAYAAHEHITDIDKNKKLTNFECFSALRQWKDIFK